MAENSRLTFGSLFAGIGGFDLGLERAGMECKWQVEIDDYARRVLAKHWPDVPKFGDIRECGKHNMPYVDVICGGFPCQDISNAGKRAGIDGERSGLWSEFARIIGEVRPRFAVVENVSALLNRGIDRVLGDLAEIGYDAEWHCIPAAAVGAPHIRDRVWILSYPIRPERESRPGRRGIREGDSVLADAEHCGLSQRRRVASACTDDEGRERISFNGTPSISIKTKSISTNSTGERQQGIGTGGEQEPILHAGQGLSLRDGGNGEFWAVEPDVGRVASRISSRVDRLRCLGNAVVPQVPEWIGRRIIEATQGKE